MMMLPSLLSTASLATSPALPRMEWAQMKELLEPTLENNNEDDNSNNDGNGGGGGGECNELAAVAAKSTNDNDDYSDNDGNATIRTMKRTTMGGGCSPTGKGLYYPDEDAFLDDIFDDDYVKMHFSTILDEPACDRIRNRIMGGPQPPGPNATEEEK
jgi:hypothetical protein